MTFARGFVAILRGAWRASPWRLAGILALTLLNYASWPLAPLVLKQITDAVVARDVREATIAALFLPILALLNQIGAHLIQVLFVELADLNFVDATEDISDLAQGPHGLAHLERADYADKLELIRNEGNYRYRSVRSAVTAIGVTIQLVLTVLLLARLQPVLLLLLVLALAPLAGTRYAWRCWERSWVANADRLRRGTHLVDLALQPDAAKEVRLFGLEDEVRRRLRTTRREIREDLFRAELKGVVASAAGYLVFALGYVGALLIVVRGAVGAHTPGDVVLAVAVAAQTNRLVFEVVAVLQGLQRSAQAADRFRWLTDLVRDLYPARERPLPAPARLGDGIRIDGLSFRYPGTEVDVLSAVDLELPAGSTIAFVGENGAGKSTLVKLLCRFYEPTGGRITADGVDLAEIEPAAWRERIAVGFQDFRPLRASRPRERRRRRPHARRRRRRGGRGGRAGRRARRRRTPAARARHPARGNERRRRRALRRPMAEAALARAMMRERPLLLILDEPTSALDAHAEHLLFERYAASARAVARATGGIAVFVSHRFSTVRMADLIVVVDGGAVVEQGTHEELIARDGVYAELFSLQAAAYG